MSDQPSTGQASPPASTLIELGFLEVTEATLLLVGWPKLTAAERQSTSLLDLCASWAAISLVEVEDALAWYDPLHRAGAILDDGTVHPDIKRVLEQRASRAMGVDPNQLARNFLNQMTATERRAWLEQNGYVTAADTDD